MAASPSAAIPHEMVFSATRKWLHTTDNGTMQIGTRESARNTISIINIQGRKKVGEIVSAISPAAWDRHGPSLRTARDHH